MDIYIYIIYIYICIYIDIMLVFQVFVDIYISKYIYI